MKEIALFNDSDVNVTDFPIAEAVLDKDSKPRIDSATQQPMTTGDTYKWSIAAGETKVFPSYVATYLRNIYGFLKEVEIPEGMAIIDEEENEGSVDTTGKQKCKHCGQEFANIKGLGMHIASRHPEKLV